MTDDFKEIFVDYAQELLHKANGEIRTEWEKVFKMTEEESPEVLRRALELAVKETQELCHRDLEGIHFIRKVHYFIDKAKEALEPKLKPCP